MALWTELKQLQGSVWPWKPCSLKEKYKPHMYHIAWYQFGRLPYYSGVVDQRFLKQLPKICSDTSTSTVEINPSGHTRLRLRSTHSAIALVQEHRKSRVQRLPKRGTRKVFVEELLNETSGQESASLLIYELVPIANIDKLIFESPINYAEVRPSPIRAVKT